jgi:hypothetical protein
MAIVEINWCPSQKELRVFALLEIVLFAVVAWLIASRLGAPIVAAVIFAVALAIGAVGLCAPRLLRPVYVVWMLAVYPLGWLVSHVAMALVFYLVITAIGLIMRACGRDPMQRRFDLRARTYWKPRPKENETDRYFRQF